MTSRVWMILPMLFAGTAAGQSPADAQTGMEIMQEASQRHYSHDYLYEEWSVILTDEMGNHETRNLRRYASGTGRDNLKVLLLFDTPLDIHGVALLATASSGVETRYHLYLPAHGEIISHGPGRGRDGTILGMDFSIEELTDEIFTGYQFIRRENRQIADVGYYLVDVYEEGIDATAANPIRRHYVRQDNFYISRTDYLDRYGRLVKQLTVYDMRQTSGGTWAAGMVRMENLRENHSTLIKVNKRIHSKEYVPDYVFTFTWLYENQPPLESDQPAHEREAARYPKSSSGPALAVSGDL